MSTVILNFVVLNWFFLSRSSTTNSRDPTKCRLISTQRYHYCVHWYCGAWFVGIHHKRINRQKRREGKGRCCYLEDGIHSIPCRNRFSTRMILIKVLIEENRRSSVWMLKKIDDHLAHTSPNFFPPKWMFFQKLFFKSSLLLMTSAAYVDKLYT